MNHATEVMLLLFLVFVAAQIGAELAMRLALPAVVGEILAGIVVGPSVLGWVHTTPELHVFAELGAVLLLFSVGLETRLEDLTRVGRVAATVGVSGVIAPFVVGAAWAYALGFPLAKSAFVAAAFVATSAGITARVLQDLGVLGRIESRVILGAAVIDDILAMLLLGVVTAIQAEGKVELVSLAFVFLQALGFVTLIALVGTKIMERRSALLDAPINPLSPLTISLALCLGLAAFASYIGLAAIIGAFLAGMVVAESRQRLALEKQVHVLMVFLVPFFFVMTGTQVELSALATWNALFMLLVATTLAVASKFIGCGLGARSLGVRSAAIVGIGMAPRGEVGIIVASLGKQAGVFSGEIYAVLIGMSLLTSVVAPPALKALFGADRNSPATEPMEGHLRNVDEAGYSG